MDLYGGANLSTLSRNFTTAETTRHLEEFERSSLGYGTESSKMVKTFGLALSVGDMPLIPNRPYKLPTQGEVDQLPTLMTTAYHTTGVLLSTAESTGTTLGGSIQMENYVKVSLDTIQHTGRHTKNALRPSVFHGAVKSRQDQRLKLPTGGTSAEFTAAMFFDVIHGHEKRWLVRSHLTIIMGFAVYSLVSLHVAFLTLRHAGKDRLNSYRISLCLAGAKPSTPIGMCRLLVVVSKVVFYFHHELWWNDPIWLRFFRWVGSTTN